MTGVLSLRRTGTIGAVALKEFRQIRRDRATLLILLFVPAFFLLVYGYALNFDIRHIGLAVHDQRRHFEYAEPLGPIARHVDRGQLPGHAGRVVGSPEGLDAASGQPGLVEGIARRTDDAVDADGALAGLLLGRRRRREQCGHGGRRRRPHRGCGRREDRGQ